MASMLQENGGIHPAYVLVVAGLAFVAGIAFEGGTGQGKRVAKRAKRKASDVASEARGRLDERKRSKKRKKVASLEDQRKAIEAELAALQRR